MSFVDVWSSPGRLWLLLALFLPLLLVHGADADSEDIDADAATCSGQQQGCGEGHIRSTSLLQLSTPLRRGSQGGDPSLLGLLAEESLPGGDLMAPPPLESEQQMRGLLQALAPQGVQLSQQSATEGSATATESLSTEVAKFMQGAAENANNAELSAASEARRAMQTVQALEELHRSSQEAKAAQDLETKKAEEVGKALVGAMQRVQRASEVEMQELAVEAEATRRLQDAAKNAREVQVLEDEGAAREARAAELLQDAIRKLALENANREDASNPMQETLRIVEQAQKVVAAEASNKARASELLQQSLQGAATAVEALKAGKEAQTSKWLQDAFRELQWMHSSWSQRTDAETTAAKRLDGALKNSESAEKLADETAASKQSVLGLMQDVVQKVRAAQNIASQEATTATLARQAAQARETLKDRSLQQALLKLKAFEEAHEAGSAWQMSAVQNPAMQAAKVSQLSIYLQGLMQNVKASSDAQQVQLAQVMQQVSQAMNAQPGSSSLQQIAASTAGTGQFVPPNLLQASPHAPMPMGAQMPPLNNFWGY